MITKKMTRAAAICIVALATPLGAQELAQSVLDEYAADMAASGMTLTPGDTMVSGSTVEWKNIKVSGPEGINYSLEFLRAEEIGGDEVRLSYPSEMAMTLDPPGEQPALDVKVRMLEMEHIVSGSAEARQHNMTVGSAVITIVDAQASDSKPAEIDMTVTLNDLVSEYTRSGSDVPNYAGAMKAASMTLLQQVNDGNSDIVSNFTYTNLTAAMDFDAVGQDTIGQLFSGDRNFNVSYGAESATGTMTMASEGFGVDVAMQSGAGRAEIGIVDGMLGVNSQSDAAAFQVTMKDLPLPPFEMSMDGIGMTIGMPMKKTEEPVPARIGLSIAGLKASDTVWGMIDPGGTLPRDAANLNIDLTAQLKWLVDLMEAQGAKAPPVEVEQVAINDVTLEIAGAAFNGRGSATLNNATMPPMPVGEVNLDLKGGIALIDKLVGIGLLPAEQGQMVKMMSGMFAVPGDGPDHLTSKIEFQENGAILANGNRIK